MSTPDFKHLRQLIETSLSDLGMSDANWSCIKVELLNQSRHRPQLPPSQVVAVWYSDRNEIELRSENGSLLKTIGIGQQATESGKGA
jgi:hypothetical protein